MRTHKDFPIGQPCHYSDRSGTKDYYLRVVELRPNGGMIILKSDDGRCEFGLYTFSENLVPITEDQYKQKNFK